MDVREGKGFGAVVDGVLPPDMLHEVLLRLPAKPICRLRAVCRSWRSFTSDPLFVAAHAARHPHTVLLAVGVQSFPRFCVDLVDLSGDIVKEIPQPQVGKGMVVSATSDLVFLDGKEHSIHVLDPSTGSISALPTSGSMSALPHYRIDGTVCSVLLAWFAFGQASSTGECKLVRIVETLQHRYVSEVITVSNIDEQWRKTENPPVYLDCFCTNGVVFKGAAYFSLNIHKCSPSVLETGCIPSFDLAMEQWSMTLQGPAKSIIEEANGTLSYHHLVHRLTLAGLKDTLCTAHWNDQFYVVDLWFLIDSEKSTWSKKYRINVDSLFHGIGDCMKVNPLLVTDEGNVVLWLETPWKGIVQIYNPVTNTFWDITQTNIHTGVGVYTGSLLRRGSV